MRVGVLLALACATACAVPTLAAPSTLSVLDRSIDVDRARGDRAGGPVLIFLHGYGSAPETFLGLAQRTDLPQGTHLILPRGPNTLASGASWWPLPSDVHRIVRERLPGMDDARARVSALLDRVAREMPGRPIVLGGFSQGAMVSLDVALHDAAPLAGLVLMSGTMIDERETRARLGSRRGLRVYVSHGREDPVIPYVDDARLAEAMRDSGLDVSFAPFEGGHVVTPRVSMEVAAFVRRCAARSDHGTLAPPP